MDMILLVDDDLELLSVQKALLESHLFHVIAASSPDEAVHLFLTFQDNISCIITDYHMPHEDGIELIQTLRQYKPSLHAFLVSGGIVNEAIPSNIHFLSKPMQIDSLVLTLHELKVA